MSFAHLSMGLHKRGANGFNTFYQSDPYYQVYPSPLIQKLRIKHAEVTILQSISVKMLHYRISRKQLQLLLPLLTHHVTRCQLSCHHYLILGFMGMAEDSSCRCELPAKIRHYEALLTVRFTSSSPPRRATTQRKIM